MQEFQFALQVLVAGIARGSLIGVVAIGIVLVFTTTRLLNFAAGEFVMVGGAFGWIVAGDSLSSWFIALVAGLVVGGIYAGGVEWLVVGPLRRRGAQAIVIVIALLGVSIVTAQVVQYWAGPEMRPVRSPWPGMPFRLGDVVVARHSVLTLVGVSIAVTAFMLVRQRTNMGLALRAVGSNREGAKVIGLNVGRIEVLAFALSGVVSALAGILIAPISGWQPGMGRSVTITAFIAAIVGGISNPLAAFFGSMLIGITGVAIEIYISPMYSTPILFVVLVLVILVRPAGLIPSRETEEGPLRA